MLIRETIRSAVRALAEWPNASVSGELKSSYARERMISPSVTISRVSMKFKMAAVSVISKVRREADTHVEANFCSMSGSSDLL